MKNNVRRFTETELAEELRNRGFEVSQRTIAEWRRNHLLPPFDVVGSGLGKGQGRDRGSWSQRELVINQALWVCDLRLRYKRYEDLYIPLWMLGCSIPLGIIRDLLTYPLIVETEAVKAEATAFISRFNLNPARKGVVEDLIDDAVHSLGFQEAAIVEEFKMPPEVMEGLLNIFLNPDCDVDDPAGVVTNSREAIDKWDAETKKLELEILQTEGMAPLSEDRRSSNPFEILKHARFIQQNFALHQLEKAMTECTDADLNQVQADMKTLCEIVLLLNRWLNVLRKNLRAEFRSQDENVFTIFVRFSKWVIWSDLSLRRNGYGQAIDAGREFVRNEIKEKVNEKLEQEIAAAAPEVAKGMEQAADAMKKFFTKRISKDAMQPTS
ncbi:MAG: hypothetical protein M3362_00595 [Acidobacteriota bacterium]|nr:hypothetical protein [Acidobacteriota bacterium]